MENLLTISEAADILGVTTQTLRKWDKDGKLTPTHTLGGHRRYRSTDIDRIVTGMANSSTKTIELLNEALQFTNDSGIKKRIQKIVDSVELSVERKVKRS